MTRAGRTSPAQQRARDTLGERYIVPFSSTPLDPVATFGRTAPVVLEIGFGMGAATAVVAADRRDVDFIGIEVHAPGVGALLKMIGEADLTNLRIVEHDAVEVVEQMIAPASLAGVLIWFPDPWHKARHNKRRLIQPAFVATLASRVAPGGFVHCATDWEEYAVQMLEVLGAEPALRNAAGDGYASPENPLLTRPVTKFETRGKRLDVVGDNQAGSAPLLAAPSAPPRPGGPKSRCAESPPGIRVSHHRRCSECENACRWRTGRARNPTTSGHFLGLDENRRS